MAISGISIAFGTLGIILNIVVAIAIHLDKSMKNPTYQFMVQLAVSDAEVMLGVVVGPAILTAAGSRPDTLVKIFAYFDAAGFKVSSYFMVLLACSRWVHFTKKGAINQVFSKKRHYAICIFVWVGLHLWYSPFLFYSGAFEPLGDSGAYTYLNNTYSQMIRYFDTVNNLVPLLLLIIFNLLSIYHIWKMRKQVLSLELRATNKQEIKLFVQCAIDSFICFLLDFFYYVSDLGGVTDPWMFTMINTLYILNFIDCAILYFLFNKKLRDRLIKIVTKVSSNIQNGPTTTPVLAIQRQA